MLINKISYLLILSYAVLFIGCAKPETITITQYKEKLTPVKCDIALPNKPTLNLNNPHNHTDIIIYYKQIESLLKGCILDETISK